MFDSIAKQWLPAYGLNGQQQMGGSLENGSSSYLDTNWGDLGYSGDPTNYSGSNGQNDQFLKNLGWTGGNPYAVSSSGSNDNGGELSGQYTPEFQQFMRDKGINFQQRSDGFGRQALQGFGADGQAIGTPYSTKINNDNAFGYATMLASLFAGGAAAGLGAGAGEGSSLGAFEGIPAGGGASSGGLAGTGLPEFAAYNGPAGYQTAALGNTAGVDFGAANGAWDVLPDAVGGGVSGGGAATDAAGMSLAEGAYPAGLGGAGGAAGGAGGGMGSYLDQAGSFLKSNPGLVNAGGSLVNGLIGAYTGNQALKRQTDATNQANALWAPYRQFGEENLQRANGLLKNPSSIAQDPGYQFTTQQGMQALDRSAAARGGLYSGAQMKGAERFGQGNANTYFDKILGRYTGAAQLGATGTTNISNNITNLGQAGAGAAMYQGQVANNAINNGLGQYNWSQYTNDLNKKGP